MTEHKNDLGKGRVYFLGGVLLLAIFLFALRLANLQISQNEFYSVLADRTSSVQNSISAARGEIIDRNGIAIAANDVVFTIRLDKNFLTDQNATILRVVNMLKEGGVSWNSSLPITYENGNLFFTSGKEDEVAKLKSNLGLQSYATLENVLSAITERYKLTEYSGEEYYILAGIRYEMERTGFEVNNPFVIASDVPMDMVTKVREMSELLPGVEIGEESVRTYPLTSVAAQILGRVTPLYAEDYAALKDQGYKMSDNIGRSGIEEYMEKELKGSDGIQSILKDKKGSVIDVTVTQEAQAGNSVQLTIDANLQKALEDKLAAVMDSIRQNHAADAAGASCVVMNPKTGEILAMVNYPTYDMNTYQQEYETIKNTPFDPLYNRSIKGLYAPGSAFKPTVGLAGLAEDIITRNYVWRCTGRYTYFSDYQPGCDAGPGVHTIVEALKFSCNTYFYDVGRQLGIDKIVQYANELGLGTKTGIELTEYVGYIASPENREKRGGIWNPGDVIQTAIGQSDTQVTPLQLAVYASTLCNDGVRYGAHLVKSVVSYDRTTVIKEFQPTVLSTSSASKEDFAIIREGMQAATSPGGTAYAAFVGLPYKIAAKTGTPQASTGSNHGTFICYGGPDEDNQIAIAVVGENISGGYLLAPVARTAFDTMFPQAVETPSDVEQQPALDE